jgi:hypothetical protein
MADGAIIGENHGSDSISTGISQIKIETSSLGVESDQGPTLLLMGESNQLFLTSWLANHLAASGEGAIDAMAADPARADIREHGLHEAGGKTPSKGTKRRLF